MLTFKKKKRKFVFLPTLKKLFSPKKNFLGSDSPSEKKYAEFIKEYGDEHDYVTSLGIKIFPNGAQFVIDAKTGRVIERDKTTRYLGRDEESGFHFYLAEGSELAPEDEAHASFVKEKQLI